VTIKVLSDPELERIVGERARRMRMEASHPAAQVVKLTTAEFDKQLGGGKPVFVDFWAVWCGPCRVMEPVIERLASKYSEKILFGKLNVDEEPDIATRYEVQSIPTFMVFRNGRPADAVVGAVGEAVLDQMIQKSLGGQNVYR
jgi:thioredoxin